MPKLKALLGLLGCVFGLVGIAPIYMAVRFYHEVVTPSPWSALLVAIGLVFMWIATTGTSKSQK